MVRERVLGGMGFLADVALVVGSSGAWHKALETFERAEQLEVDGSESRTAVGS